MTRRKINMELIIPEGVSLETIVNIFNKGLAERYELNFNFWNSLTGENNTTLILTNIETINSTGSFVLELKGNYETR